MQYRKSLNIFFTLDKKFITHFTVTLTSLLENNRDVDISVYVIHDLDDIGVMKNVMAFFNDKYNVNLNLIELDNKLFDNFLISHHISKATYFRLLFAEILPVNILSGLYLDCDVIITGSLNELATLNFTSNEDNKEKSILAVGDKYQSDNIERFKKLGFTTKVYFNAGVLLINLNKWRLDKVSGELMKIAMDYKDHLLWHDQDVLNIYFRNKVGTLDSTYNKFIEHKIPKLPIIIHYTGSSKPWQYFNNHPYKTLYWKYLKLTPFKNEKFESVTIKMVLQKYFRRLKKYANIKDK